MHYKIYLTSIFFLSLLVSCNGNKSNSIDIAINLAEKREIIIQKKILLSEMAQATTDLHNITWPILTKNKNKCKKNKNKSYGILFADIFDVPKQDMDIFLELFNKNIANRYYKKYKVIGFPIVLSVAKNSPAFDAGIEKNDIILEIEKNNTVNFRKKLESILNNKEDLNLKILRDGIIIEKRMFGINSCSYNIQALPEGLPNAYADGKKVFITLAAIKLARTKDELAFLVGHEIAHNIYHYKDFNANEANLLAINYLDKPKIRNIKSVLVWSNEKKEIEADIEGLKLAYQAGYKLKNVNDYWRRLSIFNPELINRSVNIYKSNAYRAALINKTLEKLRKKRIENE